MTKMLFLILAMVSSRVIAGYGGMANADTEVATGNGMGTFVVCGVLGGFAGYLYCTYLNSTSEKQLAPDGGAVIGFLVGIFVLPFLWLAVSK